MGSWFDRVAGRGPARCVLCAFVVLLTAVAAVAEEGDGGEGAEARTEEGTGAADGSDLLQKSLPYRTALHHDPSLEPPLEQLLKLYRDAGRIEELLAIYRQHLNQFPVDSRARAVLYRLLHRSGQVEAESFLRRSVRTCPDDGYLKFLLGSSLDGEGDPEGRRLLLEAVDAEQRTSRKQDWLLSLIGSAARFGDRGSVEAALERWRELPLASIDHVELAELLLRHGFGEQTLALLAEVGSQDAEDQVSLELLRARAEEHSGEIEAAKKRLDALLARLDERYWRREEILLLRFGLVRGKEEIAAVIAERREAVDADPDSEQAWLDLARTQRAFSRGESALATLREAHEKLPGSLLIEQALMEHFERLHRYEDYEAWIAEKVAEHPERHDLRRRHVELLFLFERDEEARAAFDELLAEVDPATRTEQRLMMARKLRPLGLVRAAVSLLEQVLEENPNRFDLMRELLELQHQIDPRSVFALLTEERLRKDGPIEQVIDLARWLNAKGFLPQSTTLLEHHLEEHPYHPDLNVLLASAYRRLGLRAKRAERLAVLREEMTSVADFRRLMNALVDGIEDEAERTETLNAELEKLATLEDGEDRRHRELALIEMLAEEGEERAALVDWLEMRIAAVDDAWRPAYRKQLTGVLSKMQEADAKLEEQLKILAEEDPRHQQRYLVRRLQLLVRRRQQANGYYGNFPEAQELLGRIEVEMIDERDSLQILDTVLQQVGEQELHAEVLAKLVTRTPEDAKLWERWLNLLAEQRMEENLRVAIRRLLANQDQVELDDARREQLKRHLLFSLWRSVAERLQQGDLAGALPFLAQAEAAGDDQDHAWVLWSRAVILDRLDRRRAYEETRARLERLAGVEDDDGYIVFPDGIRCHPELIKRRFESDPAEQRTVAALPPYDLEWLADLGDGVLGAYELGETLAVQTGGGLVGVDLATGKRLWRREVDLVATEGGFEAGSGNVRSLPGGGLVFVADGGVTCLGPDAAVAWKVPLTDRLAGFVVVDRDVLYVLDRFTGHVWCLESGNGKLRWAAGDPSDPDKEEEGAGQNPGGGFTIFSHRHQQQQQQTVAGPGRLSVAGDLVLVGHRLGRILDRRDGRILWDFTREPETELPIKVEKEKKLPGFAGLGSGEAWSGGSLHHGGWHQAQRRVAYRGMHPSQSDQAQLDFAIDVKRWFSNNQGHQVHLAGGWLVHDNGYQVNARSLELPVLRKASSSGSLLIDPRGGDPLLWDSDRLRRLDGGSVECEAIAIAPLGDRVVAINKTGVSVYDRATLGRLAHAVWDEALEEFLEGAVNLEQATRDDPSLANLIQNYRTYSQHLQWNPGYANYVQNLANQLEQRGWSVDGSTNLRMVAGIDGRRIYLLRGSRIACVRGTVHGG